MRSLLVVLCVLGPLGALPARGELPKDEQKCIVEINRNVAKVAKAQGKEICRCIKNGAKGKLVEATIEDCLTADGRGKVDKARSKLSAKLADKCPADPNAAPGFGVPAEGIDPNSLSAAAIASEISLTHRIFGSDLDTVILPAKDPNDPAVKPSSKCQLNVAKAAKKCFDTKWKVFNKCKKNGLKGKLPPGAIEGAEDLERLCLRSDPNDPNLPGQVDLKGKISKACVTKLQAKITKKCGAASGADLSRAFPRFDPNGPLTLREFVDQTVECEFCKLVNATDGLGRNCDRFDDGALNGSCDEDLTVVNLNLLHGLFCSPDACRLEDRIDLFFQWVVDAGCPDVITLQEVIQTGFLDSASLIEAQLVGTCPFPYRSVLAPTAGIDEEMLLSRHPILDVAQRILFLGFRKVLHVRIDHPFGPMDVFTTHLASGSDQGPSPCNTSQPCPAECLAADAVTVRDCQAVQMAEFIDSRHNVDAPAVVTGDFNAPPGSFVYQQFVGRGWVDVYLAAGNPECNPGSGVGCTSGRSSSPDVSEIESPLPNVSSRIDYIFLIPPGPGSACAAEIDGPDDADGDGTATRIFADDPNPFAPSCGPAPDPVCWPSDHEGVQLDLNCR